MDRVRGAILVSGVFFVLYLTSLYNFTLFHTLAELFSIVVACAVFIIAWNTRHFSSNRAFLFLGIAYAFVAAIDLLHVLSYKGMGFFAGYDANLPTQFWLAGRYMQSLSLLAAPFLIRSRLPLSATLLGFSFVSCALVVSIFAGVFPDAYIEGSGLTPFKKMSEYAIIGVLAAAFAGFRARRGEFNPLVYHMLMASVVLTVLSELSFTFYVSVFGLSNLVGHFLKIAAFFLIYRALVQVTLTEPYESLFQDLHRSERRYRSLFENMLDGFALHRVVTDEGGRAVDYVFLEVNDSFEAMTGLTAERVLGRRVTEVLPGIENDPADWIGRYGRVALEGTTERFEQYAAAIDRWYHVSAYSPERGLFCAIFEDITSRKKAEEALRVSEARYRAVGELIPFGIWVYDSGGRLEYLSDSFLSLIGRSLEECRERGWYDLLPRESAGGTRADWDAFLAGGTFWDYEHKIRTKEGAYVDILSRGVPLYAASGEVASWVGFNIDITALKGIQEDLREALAAKELLMREMNHRVKNNFLLVYSLLRLQSRTITDEASLRILKEGQDRVMAMSMLHDRLAQAPDARIDLPRYIRDLSTRLFQSFSLDPGAVELVQEIEDVDLDVDAVAPVGLILSELLANAFKHAFAEGRKGSLHIRFARDGSERFVLSVADTGPGLPPGTDIATSDSLGMELVRSLVRQLGGEMAVASAEAGTAFRIEFMPAGQRGRARSASA